jgi:AcrR family transcriptional regulator
MVRMIHGAPRIRRVAGTAKRRRPYHHGDLRAALIREAARTIDTAGVEGVTLRDVGRRVGVSRTALYRHFTDKAALLAAVAREGFQRFSRELQGAWMGAGGGVPGFQAMGAAYVRFAIANPAHYRIMFGRFRDLCESDPALAADASGSFQVLLDALASLERAGVGAGILRDDDVSRQDFARYIWAIVHGVAMLAIDGQLGPDPAAADLLTRFTIARLSDAVVTRASKAGRDGHHL